MSPIANARAIWTCHAGQPYGHPQQVWIARHRKSREASLVQVPGAAGLLLGMIPLGEQFRPCPATIHQRPALGRSFTSAGPWIFAGSLITGGGFNFRHGPTAGWGSVPSSNPAPRQRRFPNN